MANTNKNSKNESRFIDTIDHPEPGKRWTLLFIGNHGRTITLKRFKGMVILTCLVLCVSIAIAVGLLYFSLNIRSDKIQLESDFKDLKAQIEAISPKVICTLGKFATWTLLKTETPISQLRGNFAQYEGVTLMPTYHPAYLLRKPLGKREVWEDMKLVMQKLREE